MKNRTMVVIGLLIIGGIVAGVLALRSGRRALVSAFSEPYSVADAGLKKEGPPWFDGADADRKKLSVNLTLVADDVLSPVDLQFLGQWLYVVEKEGNLRRIDLKTKESKVVAKFEVLTDSEQGFLGLAFHPKFSDNHRFFVNYVTPVGDKHVTRVESWVAQSDRLDKITRERTIIEVEQPYQNHNAGQLAFGPDGFLYIGMGDGGWRYDPHDHGQNPSTLLGTMLRVDVDTPPQRGQGYVVPEDNPGFAGKPATAIFAVGLRNPWRYSFAPDGRLVVADVGQDLWEELSFVPRGANLGWNIKEAEHCFEPKEDCLNKRADTIAKLKAPLQEPFYSYGRDEGQSITGGYVVTDTSTLAGHYVFADFLTGRLWALKLPQVNERVTDVLSLGRWSLLPASFGRNASGQVFVADVRGSVYRIDPS